MGLLVSTYIQYRRYKDKYIFGEYVENDDSVNIYTDNGIKITIPKDMSISQHMINNENHTIFFGIAVYAKPKINGSSSLVP
jgi:hypothetical protein